CLSLSCHATPTTATSTLSLHDALPILGLCTAPAQTREPWARRRPGRGAAAAAARGPHVSALRRGAGARGPHVSALRRAAVPGGRDRKSTRLNSSHVKISYAVFCLKKKT